MIGGLYTECFGESIILGVYLREDERFCGLAEIYGYRSEIHKASIGYRLLEAYWGQGIATRTLRLTYLDDICVPESFRYRVDAQTTLAKELRRNISVIFHPNCRVKHDYSKPKRIDYLCTVPKDEAGDDV